MSFSFNSNSIGGSKVLAKFHERKSHLERRMDENGNKVTYKYSRSGKLVSARTTFGDNTSVKEEYSDIGTNNNGETTRTCTKTVIDANGKPVSQAEEYKQVLNSSGNLTEEVNKATGDKTLYKYDNEDNLTGSSVYDASGKPLYEYDKEGNLVYSYETKNEKHYVVSTDAYGKETGIEYNENGTQTAKYTAYNFGKYTKKTYEYYSDYSTDQKGTTTRICEKGESIIYNLDKEGDVKLTKYKQVLDKNGNVIKETNLTDKTSTAFTYDENNRVIERKFYDASGNLTGSEKIKYLPNNEQEITKFDKKGVAKEQVISNCTTEIASHYEKYEKYSKNHHGQTVRIAKKSDCKNIPGIDEMAEIETYVQVLDENGNVIRETNLKTGRYTEYEYDENRNLISKKTEDKELNYTISKTKVTSKGKSLDEAELEELAKEFKQGTVECNLVYDEKGQEIKRNITIELNGDKVQKYEYNYKYDEDGNLKESREFVYITNKNEDVYSSSRETVRIHDNEGNVIKETVSNYKEDKCTSVTEFDYILNTGTTYYYDENGECIDMITVAPKGGDVIKGFGPISNETENEEVEENTTRGIITTVKGSGINTKEAETTEEESESTEETVEIETEETEENVNYSEETNEEESEFPETAIGTEPEEVDDDFEFSEDATEMKPETAEEDFEFPEQEIQAEVSEETIEELNEEIND